MRLRRDVLSCRCLRPRRWLTKNGRELSKVLLSPNDGAQPAVNHHEPHLFRRHRPGTRYPPITSASPAPFHRTRLKRLDAYCCLEIVCPITSRSRQEQGNIYTAAQWLRSERSSSMSSTGCRTSFSTRLEMTPSTSPRLYVYPRVQAIFCRK
jgi:hypothetical protein